MKGKMPSPGLVIACIALAVALSGTGYAVTALPRNSVGAAQLKANAVNSQKVKNGSLLRADFRAGQLPAAQAGPAGPSGPQGPTGPEGPPNPNAVNSDKLDNLDSLQFLRSDGKARDSDLIDGLEAADLIQGRGSVQANALALSPGSSPSFTIAGLDDGVELTYECPATVASNGTMTLRNRGGTVNVFADVGDGNPSYSSLGTAATVAYPASATGEAITLQIQGNARILTISAQSVHRAADCHFQWQALIAVP